MAQGPEAAQRAHFHRGTRVRQTMATGIPSRAARCEPARAPGTAIEETVGEATAVPARSRPPKRHAAEGARQERRLTEIVCCPSPRRYRRASTARGPRVVPGAG